METGEDAPPITEDDIDKGMITLLNKGIIPKDVDLTGPRQSLSKE